VARGASPPVTWRMFAIRHILLPTDFSPLARRAATVARVLAETHQATLHVVHVLEPAAREPVLVPEGGVVLPQENPSETAQPALETFVREGLADLRTPLVAKLLLGAADLEITRYAGEIPVDLIVIGTHGRGIMRRILLGSISKNVLEHATCPVLMVPPAAET